MQRKPCLQKCTHVWADASPMVNPKSRRASRRAAQPGCASIRRMRADRVSAIPERRNIVRISGVFGVRGGRSGSRQTGQTVLEMALMLPLLLMLLVSVIEIGRYAYFDILISNAARAGAQYGAQSVIHAWDINGIKNAAHDDGLAAMTITPTQQCSCSPTATPVNCGGGGIGCAQTLVYVQVQATDTYSSLFSYPGIPKTLKLSSTVTMRVSQ